ncbi:MAG: 1,4-alpha-glucan branching enzyme, partial [Halomonadaceae bacterium]
MELNQDELHSFSNGEHWRAWRLLGAHLREHNGVAGTRFSVWAPNAEWVSVIGDFNNWDSSAHPMQEHQGHGIWELFIPGVRGGALYKFELCSGHTGEVVTKIDPFARHFEARPKTACLVEAPPQHHWSDSDWGSSRPDW